MMGEINALCALPRDYTGVGGATFDAGSAGEATSYVARGRQTAAAYLHKNEHMM